MRFLEDFLFPDVDQDQDIQRYGFNRPMCFFGNIKTAERVTEQMMQQIAPKPNVKRKFEEDSLRKEDIQHEKKLQKTCEGFFATIENEIDDPMEAETDTNLRSMTLS